MVISKGAWRSHVQPMQVVSGAMGREVVHYEAPPSKSVPEEMNALIDWFNRTGKGKPAEIKQPVMRVAIAHLYFKTIHPFEDGNGRIGRAISGKALSQFLGRPVLLSLSNVMELKKKDYYSSLKAAQRSHEITAWIKYFVETTLEAQKDTEKVISFTLQKTRFLIVLKKNSMNGNTQ